MKRIACITALIAATAWSASAMAEVDGFKWFLADQSYHIKLDYLNLTRSVDEGALIAEMAEHGHEVDPDLGTSARGWQLVTEMRLRPHLGVELGFVQIDSPGHQISAVTNDEEDLVERLVQRLPVSASGVTLGVGSSMTFAQLFSLDGAMAERMRLRARGGLFSWDGEVRSRWDGQVASRRRSGIDPYFGLGFGLDLGRQLEVMLEYQHLGADWDQSGLSVGIRYQYW